MPYSDPLSLSQLQSIASNFLFHINKYRPEYFYYFNMLRLTGCRPLEPLLIDLWSFRPDGLIQLQPLKSNNVRTFSTDSLDYDFVSFLLNNSLPYNHSHLKTLTRAFHVFNSFGRLSVTNHGRALYLFRYLKVKELHDSGISFPILKDIFGWKNEQIPVRYYEKNIYFS